MASAASEIEFWTRSKTRASRTPRSGSCPLNTGGVEDCQRRSTCGAGRRKTPTTPSRLCPSPFETPFRGRRLMADKPHVPGQSRPPNRDDPRVVCDFCRGSGKKSNGEPCPVCGGRGGELKADASTEQVVVAYHERTKHHFHRYAASPGCMDWATQPDPFRRYQGADLVRLPLPKSGWPLPYWQLYALGDVPSEPLSLESISPFFRYALSLTAWKRFHDTTWSLRANPSSGNLHPTEGYAVLPPIDRLGDAPAVYHYAPRSTLSSDGRFSTRRRGASSAHRFPRAPSSWASPLYIGGKRGSTGSARSATASTMRGTPLQRCALRRRLLAGVWCSSTG